jgi:hypothetical protein
MQRLFDFFVPVVLAAFVMGFGHQLYQGDTARFIPTRGGIPDVNTAHNKNFGI